MKKIVVEKNEGIAEIIDSILNEPDKDITLVIPRGSTLGNSLSNFRLLKRESDTAGRSLAIESVDDTILAFARESKIEGTHPLWRGVKSEFSDIVPANRGAEDASDADDEDGQEKRAAKKPHGKKEHPVKLTVRHEDDEDVENVAIEEEDEETEEKEDAFLGGKRFFKGGVAKSRINDDDDEDSDGGRGSKKLVWAIIIVIVLVVAIFGVLTFAFARATVSINFEQTPWQDQGNFVADKSVSTTTTGTASQPTVIPAQVFTSQKNITQTYPASGQANVSIKAQGTITIYNDYSSAPQELVATTRFLTPDGKIFRLVNDVTVPGAQVTNGQITPSSIDAPIVADQAGPDYNVGPVAKLTIPGFANSPRENGFYGQIKTGTSGGATGVRAVPTAADIKNAEASTTAILQATLTNGITTSYPNNFKILDGATNVQTSKLTVNTTTDQNGDFSVFGVATLQAIGFDEAGLQAYLLSLAQTSDPNSVFVSSTLSYSNVQANFTNGQVSFTLVAVGSLEPAFSPDDFKGQIEGKSISDARAVIAGLPGLSEGNISVWPAWAWTIPSNPDKIQVNAN